MTVRVDVPGSHIIAEEVVTDDGVAAILDSPAFWARSTADWTRLLPAGTVRVASVEALSRMASFPRSSTCHDLPASDADSFGAPKRKTPKGQPGIPAGS